MLPQENVITVSDATQESFMRKFPGLAHVLLFTKKATTTAMYKALALEYRKKMVFGEAPLRAKIFFFDLILSPLILYGCMDISIVASIVRSWFVQVRVTKLSSGLVSKYKVEKYPTLLAVTQPLLVSTPSVSFWCMLPFP